MGIGFGAGMLFSDELEDLVEPAEAELEELEPMLWSRKSVKGFLRGDGGSIGGGRFLGSLGGKGGGCICGLALVVE